MKMMNTMIEKMKSIQINMIMKIIMKMMKRNIINEKFIIKIQIVMVKKVLK